MVTLFWKWKNCQVFKKDNDIPFHPPNYGLPCFQLANNLPYDRPPNLKPYNDLPCFT